MTLGKAGMPGDAPGFFNRPSAVAVAPNGDIFIADCVAADAVSDVFGAENVGKGLRKYTKN